MWTAPPPFPLSVSTEDVDKYWAPVLIKQIFEILVSPAYFAYQDVMLPLQHFQHFTSTFSTFHFNIFNISFQHFVHGYIVLPALENDIYIFPGITNSNSSPRTIRFENENENGSCACSHDQYSESPWRYFYRFHQTRISIHAQDLEISSCYFNVSQKKRKPCVTLGNVTKHCDIRIVIFIIVMKDEHFFCWHPQS